MIPPGLRWQGLQEHDDALKVTTKSTIAGGLKVCCTRPENPSHGVGGSTSPGTQSTRRGEIVKMPPHLHSATRVNVIGQQPTREHVLTR